jgi:SAM-dependent methyltransferase
MWDSSFVRFWRSYVPPCRPSRFEIELCKKELSSIRKNVGNRPPVILILGSTNEYRDFAFEERCEVVVVDNSEIFHKTISEDRRYKNSLERIHFVSWEDMNFWSEFDLVVGDLVVGNVKPDLVNTFVENIHKSLKPNGVFITKSFFFDPDKLTNISLSEAFHTFEENHIYEDPFPYLAYQLTIAAMNKETHILNFRTMYQHILEAFNAEIISKRTYDRYLEFGWHEGEKIEFYVMPKILWENLIHNIFSRFVISYAPYSWANDYPIYCIYK